MYAGSNERDVVTEKFLMRIPKYAYVYAVLFIYTVEEYLIVRT